jgi:vancomycin permeability regulator SanA
MRRKAAPVKKGSDCDFIDFLMDYDSFSTHHSIHLIKQIIVQTVIQIIVQTIIVQRVLVWASLPA